MDIQSQVAARRAQLAQQERDQKAEQSALEAQRRTAQQQQERDAIDSIASDLSANGVIVERDEDELSVAGQPLPALDVASFKQAKIDRLLNREARKRWTAGENWLVIGCIVGGICLIHLGGFGFIPLLIGLWRRSAINKKHRAAVRDAYPSIFIVAESVN